MAYLLADMLVCLINLDLGLLRFEVPDDTNERLADADILVVALQALVAFELGLGHNDDVPGHDVANTSLHCRCRLAVDEITERVERARRLHRVGYLANDGIDEAEVRAIPNEGFL